MAFQQHLTQDEIDALADATLAIVGDYSQVRPVLFAGILPAFRGAFGAGFGLPQKVLVLSDLVQLNTAERLIDGSIPLKIWLKNLSGLSGGRLEAETVRAALQKVSGNVGGAPVVKTQDLPELKEKIVHRDDMVPYEFMGNGVGRAGSVVKLMVPRYDNRVPSKTGANPTIYLGTGWLIGNGSLIITNHHVVNARNGNEVAASDPDLKLQAANTFAVFDYDADGVQGTRVAVLELLRWNPALDYAVLRIDDSQRKPLPLRLGGFTPNELADKPPVNIIQHPDGRPKLYAIRNNLVSAVDGIDIRYFTDTNPGSSGSPVLDDTWRVVALHRGATLVTNVKFQGHDVAYVNVGTAIGAIVEDLAKNPHPQIPALQ
jgi:endonuclease G, mitochondrial